METTTTEPAAPSTQLATAPKRETRVVVDNSPIAYLLDTARFEHMHRIATVMAGASLIPDHMWRGKGGDLPADMVKANCFLVVNQALRWGMDPFAVVPETYVVGGKLGFQGKLVAAVVNSRAPIKRPLNYEFSGTKGKDDYTVTVSATFDDEDKPRSVTLSVGEAKTDNKIWAKDPEQKLVYSGATRWARRHCPEIILGVLTDDDLERIQATGPGGANAPVAPSFVTKKVAEPKALDVATEVLPPGSESSQVTQALDRGNVPVTVDGPGKASDKPSGGSKSKGGGVAEPQGPVSPATTTEEKAPAQSGAGDAKNTEQPSVAAAPAAEGASAPAEDESQDPAAPLLREVRAVMGRIGATEAQVVDFARKEMIISPRAKTVLPLDDWSDNQLGLLVNKLPKLEQVFKQTMPEDAP